MIRLAGRQAVGDDLRRFFTLTWTLATTDWKLRFYGSALGYVWSLARPFLLFGVIYLVFIEFAKIGKDINHFAVYVLFAMVLFEFFAEITVGSLNSLVTRENMLRKMRFPRLVIPLSVGLTALFNVCMTMSAVFIFAIASGVYPTWGWLQLPILIGLIFVFAVGLGMALSVLYVRFRDIQPIWAVAERALFYASPVLYVTTMVPEHFQHPYAANPIATVLTQMRHAVLDSQAPSAWEALGGGVRILLPLGIIVACFLFGWWLFNREAPRIAERL